MSNPQWESVTLGDVTTESRKRAGDHLGFLERSVYGVDRSVGLTSVAKYAASSLERYKILEHNMFAYNPMRLNIGSIGYCSKDIQPGLVSPDYVVFQCNPESLDPDFLSYYINSPDWKEWTANAGVGSVRMRIYYKELARLPLWLPPLPEQHAITGILSTLDDKIELIRRMNQTLESMARAVFRQWFVENEDVGDWDVGKVEDICVSIENGGTPKRMEPAYWNDGTVSWFKTGELNDTALIDSEEKITEIGLSNSACRLWDSKTVLIALYASPTVGRLGILEIPATANQACSALVAKPEYGYLFLFYSLLFSRDELQRVAVGAAQQNINQSVVKNHKIIIPPTKLVKKFHDTIEPLYSMQLANLKESRTLANLRDTLLPKLMRGEVRVKDF